MGVEDSVDYLVWCIPVLFAASSNLLYFPSVNGRRLHLACGWFRSVIWDRSITRDAVYYLRYVRAVALRVVSGISIQVSIIFYVII